MLVRFDSKAGTITMFGDVAVDLLRMMGQSGAIPGAILAPDIPAAVERLRHSVGGKPATPPPPQKDSDESAELSVNLNQRAFPLIELLQRAAKNNADVIWEQEQRSTF